MCTAINITEGRHLFGRTLDLEFSYGQQAVILPKNLPISFLALPECRSHPVIMGTAFVFKGRPLLFDGINDRGLCVAGLNFGAKAVYNGFKKDKLNLASFELIPWLLSSFGSVDEVYNALKNVNILEDSVSAELPATPLHWLISDKERSITAEPLAEGLRVYENPVGVLTNAPEFSYHITRLADFMELDSAPPKNRICPNIPITPYARGLSAVGLPGDMSSSSRFVRTVFSKYHTAPAEKGKEISRFFHIVDTVAQPEGFVKTEDGKKVSTLYTLCADVEKMTCFYTTYSCRRIYKLYLSDFCADSDKLIVKFLPETEDIAEL